MLGTVKTAHGVASRTLRAVFRPPSEARSLILQLTEGCSWNRCTYCAMYRSKRYPGPPCRGRGGGGPRCRGDGRCVLVRLFLADGDALAAPDRGPRQAVLEGVREHLPTCQRVGVYGDSRAILARGPEALASLRELGLGIVYFGAETGDPETLRAVRKGTTVAQAGRSQPDGARGRLETLRDGPSGSGRGPDNGERHARATGRFLVAAAPTYAAAAGGDAGARNRDARRSSKPGDSSSPTAGRVCRELRWMLAEMEGFRGPFHANHASNHLPLKLRLPRDRDGALKLIDDVLAPSR
jgi:hypothetical protein